MASTSASVYVAAAAPPPTPAAARRSARSANLASRASSLAARLPLRAARKPSALSMGRTSRRVCVAAASSDGEELSLTPGKPKTPFGEMLKYYLTMEPQLFQTAVDEQFQKLVGLKEAAEKKLSDSQSNASAALDMVLYRRMDEVKAKENRDVLEDLMYLCVLEKFVALQVPMLPRMDGVVDVESANLKALTDGIHSREALEMVKEHLKSMMGPTATAYSNAAVKMSKLQMTQVYAASIMFGYFIRRVDKRFQLEQQFGTLEDEVPTEAGASVDEETLQRLERLFHAAGEQEVPDAPAADAPVPKRVQRKATLKEYVEGFDQATLVETANVLSLEAASLVERQSSALFGDIKELQTQMQAVIGEDASSMEDLMKRISDAVQGEKVDVLTMTVGTQRRAVLEAVAYGTFLRDVETHVDTEYHLITPARVTPRQLGE